MKRIIFLSVLFAIAMLSCSSGSDSESIPSTPGGSDSDSVPTPVAARFLGGDVSMLPKYEASGVVYRDSSGRSVDALQLFRQQQMNAMRVRLFVSPNGSNGVVQDFAYVKSLAHRIKNAGLRFMLDFHYSDTWADPERQIVPSAWSSLTPSQLEDKLYTYTRDVLSELKAEGLAPDIVQTGNEITYGMFYTSGHNMLSYQSTTGWEQFSRYMKSAVKACREVCPSAKVVLHIERSGDKTSCLQFFNYMKYYGVDYDVIGLSYYPHWHGTLSTFSSVLTSLESTFRKEIMVCEFAYNYVWYPADARYTASQIGYPATVEGQRAMTSALVDMLRTHSLVSGLFWWFPEENESLGSSGDTALMGSWSNRGLFMNHTPDAWQRAGYALPALYELKRFLE